MLEKEVEIVNKLGLHARAATLLVKLAGEFDASIIISCSGMEADATSIMDVLMLAATKGTMVRLRVAGVDENEESLALNKIVELIENRFDEKE